MKAGDKYRSKKDSNIIVDVLFVNDTQVKYKNPKEEYPSLVYVDHFHDMFEPVSSEPDDFYDFINPNHYKQFSKEVIDMMVSIWGAEAVATHCEICAFKYRMRMGEKPDQPIERDLEKVRWYLNKAKELREKWKEAVVRNA